MASAVALEGALLSLDGRNLSVQVGSRAIPGALVGRSGHRTALSLRHGIAVIAGGVRADGALTRDLWSVPVAEGEAFRVLAAGSGDAATDPAPFAVQSIGYEPRRTLAVFVDYVEPHGASGTATARIVAVDLAQRAGHVLAVMPRLGVFDRVDVVARGDGTWVLVGQSRGGREWKAFDFAVSDALALRWLGAASAPGTLVNPPVNATEGVMLPTTDARGSLRFHRLERAAFRPDARGCQRM